ncbi:flavin-containing monooxygenase FMO GS-OX5-like isoform X3 [Humulus lupulus]|uniref:flavin-containing monooxygenase FMO GS-OX5-like isoform X3 n=1 Tax=Humulus lupulus TaxID=3486 RepID=UPI002B40A8CB|nr:flavin-containing monooxygenase FMO GS-OX5-like isoform X3 [Humulus lupulus]
MGRSVSVGVIGAGVAGLCAARELKSEGHRVVVFEKGDRIGGTWVYDPRVESDPLSLDSARDIVHGSLYRALRTNLPRQLMGFLDYPFSKRQNGDSRTFPGHEEVLWFLTKFAHDFGLVGLVRFNTEIVRVGRVGERNGEWLVESMTRGSDSVSEVFEAVVVCTGNFVEPHIPALVGIEKWPRYQIHSHNYRVPEQFRGQIDHVCEDGRVAFQDGSSVCADTIFYCTGFKYHYPFLETNGIVTVDENRVGPLYSHVFPPSLAPGLSFIGIPVKGLPFNTIELQSKWIAHVLSGKVFLPKEEEMMASTNDFYRHMQDLGLPKRSTHFLTPYQTGYQNWLCAQIGLPPLENWRYRMYEESIKNIKEIRDGYKDQWDDTYWQGIIKTGSRSASE